MHPPDTTDNCMVSPSSTSPYSPTNIREQGWITTLSQSTISATMNTRTFFLLLAISFTLAQYHLAIPSTDNECKAQCPSSNSTCCNCCASSSTCMGNRISTRCCPTYPTSGFCGCLANRAFCSGYVYNATATNGTDVFGSCYDIEEGKCSYSSSSNLWVVCPISHEICQSSSFFSCCAPDTYCITSIGNSTYPICQPRNAAQPAETISSTSETISTWLSTLSSSFYSRDPTTAVIESSTVQPSATQPHTGRRQDSGEAVLIEFGVILPIMFIIALAL
ncbi:hypothetical protein PROFUN_10903 [Planoprotostelium fungivorum]|uniref:Uncharacterized protein n=1 Tax=Planoprotostelium fungivorum TaxID=1890364 RepID=A0A2P6NC55_9EUKA|nr:hypothetical protein PROFUN_10903 [Planoprotostelium fungivorum]